MSISPVTLTTPVVWTRSNLTQENLNRRVAEIFREIVADANQRMASYKTNPGILGAGYWYPMDYYRALQATGNTARLEFLRQRHAFFHGYAPKAFDHIDGLKSITGKQICAYKLKASYTPSQGLDSIRNSLCFLDCQEAIELAYYRVIKEILPSQFDRMFSSSGTMCMRFDPNIGNTPLIAFFNIRECSDTASVALGESTYFRNLRAYQTKHVNGAASGYHVVCIQNNPAKFTAFDFSEEGLTEDAFEQNLLDKFNLPRDVNEQALSAEFLAKADALLSEESKRGRARLANCVATMEVFQNRKRESRLADDPTKSIGFVGQARFLNARILARYLP